MLTLISKGFIIHIVHPSEKLHDIDYSKYQSNNEFVGYFNINETRILCGGTFCDTCEIFHECNDGHITFNVISEYFPHIKLEYPEYFI